MTAFAGSAGFGGGLLDGFEDTHVAGAAAEVSGEAFLISGEWGAGVWPGDDAWQGSCRGCRCRTARHRAPGSTAGWVEFVAVGGGEAFDGGDLGAFRLQDGDEAGVDELSVHDDGTGAALAFATALLCAGEAKVLAEDVEQALHGRGGEAVGCPLTVSWISDMLGPRERGHTPGAKAQTPLSA